MTHLTQSKYVSYYYYYSYYSYVTNLSFVVVFVLAPYMYLFLCICVFVHLYLCIYVLVYLTVQNIMCDVLGPLAFQKYSIIRVYKVFRAL